MKNPRHVTCLNVDAKDRPNELLWMALSRKPDGFDACVQLWRHGESRRLMLSSTEGLILLTTGERMDLGRLLLGGES